MLTSPSFATPLPGSTDITDLRSTRDWQIEIDGETVENAAVFYSDYEASWLVQVPDLGTLLISPRGRSVQRIDPAGLHQATDGATLNADSAVELITSFTSRRGVMSFEVGDHQVALMSAPPLLGRQSLASTLERHPDFGTKAASYRSTAAKRTVPRRTKSAGEVTVRVYFGSWSPICQRIVPKILAVEEEWQNAGVRFEYYGLPKTMTDDALAVEQRISGVPTVVLMSGDEEVERLTGRQLDDPAEALSRALSSR